MKIPKVEGEPRWSKLQMRLGWVFKKNHRSDSVPAIIRSFWHVVIRGYVYEICKICGRPVSGAIHTYWLSTNKLWEEVNGQTGGTLCPRCFARKAEKMGNAIAWLALPMKDVDDYHRTTTQLERIFDEASGALPQDAGELLSLIRHIEIETVKEKPS